ncbi:MAG: hypothetical protein HY927_05700 [Elusimicrobia bacterium]|nr:hypothetical protein [Elusimicrobiota bacterium]
MTGHGLRSPHPHSGRRERPQLLDRLVVGLAVLLMATAVFLGVRRMVARLPAAGVPDARTARVGVPEPPLVPGGLGLPADPPPAAVPPPAGFGPISRTEPAVSSIPPIAIARTGRPPRKKVVVPVPK